MKKAKTVIVVLIVFLLSVWLFFPWNAVLSYVTEHAFSVAAENGIFVSARTFSANGIFDTEFVYNGVQADFPLFRFKTDMLTVNPKMLAALFGKRSLSVNMGRGTLQLATKQQLPWNEGSLELSADKDTIFVRDIAISGAFSARGFIEVARINGKISRAQLTMRIPQEAETAFEFLSKGAIPGLSKVSQGNWRLIR